MPTASPKIQRGGSVIFFTATIEDLGIAVTWDMIWYPIPSTVSWVDFVLRVRTQASFSYEMKFLQFLSLSL